MRKIASFGFCFAAELFFKHTSRQYGYRESEGKKKLRIGWELGRS